jgi:hypothetical protein
VNVALLAVAGLVTWIFAGVALAASLGPRLRRAAGEVEDSHRERSMSAGPVRAARWALPGSVMVVVFASSTGLAAAGALPHRAQEAASAVLGSVGVDVPVGPARQLARRPSEAPQGGVDAAAGDRRASISGRPVATGQGTSGDALLPRAGRPAAPMQTPAGTALAGSPDSTTAASGPGSRAVAPDPHPVPSPAPQGQAPSTDPGGAGPGGGDSIPGPGGGRPLTVTDPDGGAPPSTVPPVTVTDPEGGTPPSTVPPVTVTDPDGGAPPSSTPPTTAPGAGSAAEGPPAVDAVGGGDGQPERAPARGGGRGGGRTDSSSRR